jgi:hypothetical protein
MRTGVAIGDYENSSFLLGTPLFDEELVKFLQWLAHLPPNRSKLLRQIGYLEAVDGHS